VASGEGGVRCRAALVRSAVPGRLVGQSAGVLARNDVA